MALRHRYRVAQGCAVNYTGQKGTHTFKAGTFLPPDLFTQEQVDEHVRSGFVQAVNQGSHELPDVLVEKAPGTENPLTIKTDRVDGLKTSAGGKAPDISPWVVDPESIKQLVQAKDVDSLNVMILERDADAFGDNAPFETVEEAATFLTQDFGKTA